MKDASPWLLSPETPVDVGLADRRELARQVVENEHRRRVANYQRVSELRARRLNAKRLAAKAKRKAQGKAVKNSQRPDLRPIVSGVATQTTVLRKRIAR